MRKTVLLVMMAFTIASFTGCGTEKEVPKQEVSDTKVESEVMETEKAEVEPEEETEAVDMSKATYTENDIAFVLDNEKFYDKTLADGKDWTMDTMEAKGVEVTLKDSVDIFNLDKEKVGYTKKNVSVRWEKRDNSWCVISYKDEVVYLIKTEEFEKATRTEDKVETPTKEEPKKEAPSKEEKPSTSNNGGNNEQPAPTPSYSDGEVVGIVESTLRSAGLKKPEEYMTAEEIAEFGSLGGMTSWVEFNVSKTNPQADANGVLEFYSLEHYNMYYLEITGTTSSGVTIRAYYGTI